ncbi:Holliday junction ATP-dependent DNA helicase RuvA [Devosia pacifica]|uniref:Holliday junction branch migration complex subunit RuvA n=1 Tax=Devosia pacifica TaxID=1335967 RepID=A0A918SFJ3_9HYPH|nr:Holliday junction branch migration protein RuvA [Devosia pacifica]GHA37920.1 Holliday junction ATP-dependent DNA helicase RuvA [Devosia pacifica]
MIGKLKGQIDSFGDDRVLIDVGGVCYEAFCSSRTLRALPRVGESAVLHIETYVREDMIRLFGFATEAEKSWFHLLMTVQGVGSRVALAILGTASPSELLSAIALQDKTMIGRASGVGPKLAQRILSELKGKIPAIGAVDPSVLGLQSSIGEGTATGSAADAVSALVNLGYSSAQASGAIARIVARDGDDIATDKLIRLGLKELSA